MKPVNMPRWTAMASRAKAAGATRKRRAALAAGAAALAAAAAGTAAAAQPAAAATARQAAATATTAASVCNPKTDIESHVPGYSSTWSNVCGTGTWSREDIAEVRDATAPYHRIWIHAYNINGGYIGAWCAWGPNDTKVPSTYYNNGSNIQVSANTARC